MSIGVLAAIPVVGEFFKAGADFAKSATSLAQPFADVLAKALGNALEPQNKTVDFSATQDTEKRKVTFAS
ncbi:hypothetical protein [Pseudomonas sp. KBW05]|uniref:hypothetical protein n=1 Tax=Pseudomonas sp. KBW05 TaxID=2153360 RepID=UPI000F5AD529|nr:hypothetical protein [Pseudomonas sp. KBW05]RQO60781.1 hypothetical protein DBR46_02490 [Pseudomonas sp. KBW05]